MKHILLSTTKDEIKKGVDMLADVVKVTLGGKGKNVIINNGYQNVQIINDGVSIAREVELEDEVQNTGATLAKQAAEKTNDEAGDGTTTTIVLLQAYLNEMSKIKTKDSRGLREEIKKQIEYVIDKIDKVKKDLQEGDILKIAKNSALDEEIAKTISELIAKIGKDGVISVEDSRVPEIKSEVVNGIKIDDGYITPLMMTNKENLKAEIKNAPVLLTKKRLDSVQEMLDFLQELKRANKSWLVIFCEDITDEVAGFLVANKLQGIFTTVVVKTRNMDDIETVTGAQIISEENQKKLSLDVLGEAGRVVVSKYNTIVTDGKVDQTEIDEKVVELKSQLEIVESDYEKQYIVQRIAKLTGGVSVIKVGGENDQETKEKKLKLEDALNAVRSAMDEGIVEGGGITLMKISLQMSEQDNKSEIQREAHELVERVIQAPFRQILINADEKYDDVAAKVKGKMLEAIGGYNVITQQWEDFYESGIIDPAKVLKCALRNAFAMGNQILTAEASVIIKKTKPNE